VIPTVTPKLVANIGFERGLRRLGGRLPILWRGTVLDGELTAGRFEGTMAALYGSKRHRPDLRYVLFDVPVLAGVDLRPLPWSERRERLELLAEAFDIPIELSPIVEPSRASARTSPAGGSRGSCSRTDLDLPRRLADWLVQGQ
jgi:hypothetical protein